MERRLAAILAADVVGYSRLMGEDEAGTLRALTALRKSAIEPLIAGYRGRLVKLMGDGFLIEFASVVDAVACAIAWQAGPGAAASDKPLRFRIGVNLGDVMSEENDIYGDGVNVAARLQEIAEPGGIMLSATVLEHVRGRIDAVTEDRGEVRLKNIDRPIRVFRIAGTAGMPEIRLSLPDKPSIAVMPFQNISDDVTQEYFTDGMVEELITALSRFRQLFVIARNSSFTYKGRMVDVKQIGRELGVRYVLAGSVRKAAERLRITGQLIDASTGAHLWAERFDGTLADVFDLQDQVTAKVIGALAPKLEAAEIARAMLKPTESLGAYDCYLRGMGQYHLWSREANLAALSLFKQAFERDQNYAAAYGMAARCFAQRKAGGWIADRDREREETAFLARRAVELGQDDSVALGTAGFALAWVRGAVEEGAGLVERALALNPNFSWGWGFSGWINVWLGMPEIAHEHLARALRLSPLDPLSLTYQTALSCAHFFSGRHAEALAAARVAVRDRSYYAFPHCVAAASGAVAGQLTEARQSMLRLRELMPDLRVSNLNELFPLRRPEDIILFAESLRQAGLPE